MTAVRARSLVAQVHDAMCASIASGEFPPGAAVSIADVAKRHGISPTPVREAFARLAAEGQLRLIDNIGYSVPALPSAQNYVDWAIARVVVESNALLYILGPLDTRVLDEADVINTHIRNTVFGTDSGSIRKFSELNWHFHGRLIALARNPLLDDIHARLYAAPQFSRIFLGRGIPNQALVATEHAKVLRQLRRGDRSAASASLRDHIIDSLERDARLSDVSISLKRIVREQTTASAPVKTTRRSR
ncbi:MAG: GntR family transcriptional regulator [Betaproteobacteria bacterium]